MAIARLLPIAAAALGSVLACADAAAETFILFDAPAAESPGTPTPSAINADGTVVGTITSRDSFGSTIYTAFVRTADGTLTTLRPNPVPPPLPESFAFDINDAGIVVGGDGDIAYTYDSTSGAVTLYNDPSAIYGTAFRGINAHGDLTGVYSDGSLRAFVLRTDGTETTLPTADLDSVLPRINDQGDAAGMYGTPDSRLHGLAVSHDGTVTQFEFTLLAHPTVVGINNNGTIVGYATGSNLRCHSNATELACGRGFLRAANGAMATFQVNGSDGTPDDTYTGGINNAGTVVGYHMKPVYQAPVQGFVRTASGAVTSFAVPGMHYTYATAINENGVVAGYAQDDNYVAHGFIRLP